MTVGPTQSHHRSVWRRTGPGSSRGLARTVVVVSALALVEAGVRGGLINPLFVTPPSVALGTAARGVADGTMAGPLLLTLSETAIALLISAILGVGLGYLLWRFEAFGQAYEPWVAGLFAAPLILLYPIPLVLFGRTGTAIVAQATVMAMPPIILYTVQGFAGVGPQLLKVAAVHRLSRWQGMRHVLLPAAAPTLVTGLRLGLTYILVSVVSMEYLAQIGGLGKVISEEYLRFDLARVYAAVVIVILITAVLVAVVGKLQWIAHR
jgi:ABC-type nitrate/sulfonate/bicarbonate transport system permease component